MKIIPRVLPGPLVSHNKGALVWSDHGLIAYGANTIVAVIDSTTMQRVTALHSHRSPITKISWAPSLIPADDSEERLLLASADTSGFIVIFDVTAGKARHRLSETNKVVNALELFYTNGTELSLLSLHQSALLILWNPKSGEQIWKKSFTESLNSFTRDPFNSECIVLNGGGFVQYVTDFSPSHAPSDGTRFFLSPNSSEPPPSPLAGSTTEKSRMASMLFDIPRRSRLMLSDRNSKSSNHATEEEAQHMSNLVSVLYHRTRRNTLILVYIQDIIILDLDIKQTISIVSLERSTCPFVEVYPCRYRDAMYCLHDNGTVVLRIKKLIHGPEASNSGDTMAKPPEFFYESHCSSDGMRVTKTQKVYGLAVCPSSELKAAIITSDGKLLVWELQPLSRYGGEAAASPVPPQPVLSISEVLRPSTCGDYMITEEDRLYFMLTGITNSLAQGPFVVKMCPPLTTKNFHLYQPHLAVGSVKGVLQVYDIQTGILVRDESVLSCQIRGIEWASLHSLVMHGCENLHGNTGRSELAFVNIKTGKVTNFRPSKPDEGVIQIVRISHMKQYMVIVFKNKPMELWEMKTLTLLREMPTNFPTITALEWSPSSFKKKLSADDSESYSGSHNMMKEHFVFTDNTCLLHHYIVEGSLIKDGSTIGAQGVSGTVTAMGWKNELLCLGDVNSSISFWDLRHKKSANWAMSKGMVRKIRFAPGKDNSKILMLFNEEVQVYDRLTYKTISSLKFPKAIGRVSDTDWAGSDKIVLSIADGYVAITDVSMLSFMSHLKDIPESAESYLPCLLPSARRLSLKYQLYHQSWCSSSLQLPQRINIPEDIKKRLEDTTDVSQKCLIASHIFGEQFSIDFWTVASHYIKTSKSEKLKHVSNPTNNPNDQLDLFVPSLNETEETIDKSSTNPVAKKFECLESSLGMLCTNQTFKRNELSRAILQDHKKYGSEARLDCARRFILLGEFDRAVHLLLQSEADSSSSYTDSLRACLLATVRTSGASQSTLKLVATSLIAHGKLTEGVELLCLIDKSLDACRYLQSYGHWNEAVWLSKVTLQREESAEVVNRWINEYLSSPTINQQDLAVLAALSIGDLMKTIELLYGMQCFSTATMFIEACFQDNLLQVTEQNSPIIEAVYLQYGRLLKSAGLTDGAVYCWEKAGEQGKLRLAEIETAASSD